MSDLLAHAAHRDAARRRHPVVLPEHLLVVALASPTLRTWLSGLGHDPQTVADDLEDWLGGLKTSPGADPAPGPVTRELLAEIARPGPATEAARLVVALMDRPDTGAFAMLKRRGLVKARLRGALDQVPLDERRVAPPGLYVVAWDASPGPAPEADPAARWVFVGERCELGPSAESPPDPLEVDQLVVGGSGDTAAEVERALARALRWARALPVGPRAPDRVWWVSRGDGAGAALLGLGRVLALERPELRVTRLRLPPGADLAAVLRAESGRGGSDEVRWDGTRKVPRLAPLSGTLPERARRADGALVVTGGQGALGVRLARHLSDGFRRIVLIGRSRRPEAEALRADLGDRLVLEEADCADAVAMAAVFARLDVPVRLAVHAAGVAGDASLAQVDPATLAEVCRAKLGGAEVLERLTAGAGLDGLVFLTSVAGVLGSPGQGVYAAANAALDHRAERLRDQGVPAVAIASGPWSEAGMSVPHLEQQLARGLEAFGTPAGLACVDAALDLGLSNVVAARFAAEPRWGAAAGVAGAVSEDEALAWIAEAVRRVTGGAFDPDRPLRDQGLDSMAALEVRRALIVRVGRPLSPTLLFEHPNARALAAHLARGAVPEEAAPAAGRGPGGDVRVAVVGAACRLPGGVTDPDALWALLQRGVDTFVDVPPERFDVAAVHDPAPATPGRTCARRAGLVEDLASFDAAAFGVPGWEADWLDPQQRMLLQCGVEALAASGRSREELGADVGVFVGVAEQSYAERYPTAASRHPAAALMAGHPAFLAGRLAATLGLRGPAVAVNTACSSSLVALHDAMVALRDGSCSVALVGGVQALCGPGGFVSLSQLGLLSPTDRCRPFDADADGFVRGEGCVVLVLRRLADALADGDPVLGVLRGAAVGHTGGAAGLLVPTQDSQVDVLKRALRSAGVAPVDVDHVEAHAVGTPLADLVEVEACAAVYGHDRTTPATLTSSKSVLGHLEAASGLASLLKVLLMLRHGSIPAQVGLERPHPDLPLGGLSLVRATTPWPRGDRPRLAGVSAFGLGGTNAHVVVEEAPLDPRIGTRPIPARPTFRSEPHWLAVGEPVAPVAPLPTDRAAIVADLRRQIAELLGRGELTLGEDGKLLDAGFDSMRAVELRARLLRAGVDVPLRVLMLDATLATVADAVASAVRVPAGGSDPAPPVAQPAQASLVTHGVAVVLGMGLMLLVLLFLRRALPDYAPALPELEVTPTPAAR